MVHLERLFSSKKSIDEITFSIEVVLKIAD